jgi:bacterioferritin
MEFFTGKLNVTQPGAGVARAAGLLQCGQQRRASVKGNPEVIAYLQEVLTAELTAINQYFLHAEMCENWGYERLGKITKKESIEEMRHAEWLLHRMLYLDGSPSMSQLFPLRIGQTVKEQLQNDLALELEAVPRLNRAIACAVTAGDNGSRDLFERILKDEEHHVDYLEAQLHMIQEMGYDNYLAQQLKEEE